MGNRYDRWLSVVQFNPDSFLNNILNRIDHVIVTISDGIDNFYTYNGDKLYSDLFMSDTINFRFRSWRVTTFLTEDYAKTSVTNSSSIIKIIMSCIVALIFMFVIASIYTVDSKRKHENNRRIQIIQTSRNIAFHEIRNILNAAYIVFQLKSIENMRVGDIAHIKSCIVNIIDLVSNILDYEKLLLGKYKVKYKPVCLLSFITAIVERYPFININVTYDSLPGTVYLDSDKYQEIIQNGLNNACKFATGDILIRIQTINDGILIEIINDYCSIPENFVPEDLFIPFFIRESEDITWTEQIKLLQPDRSLHNMVAPLFGYDNLQQLYRHEAHHIDASNFTVRSTGMGLSISRLASKALGGDCGLCIDTVKHKARYWCFVTLGAESSYTDVDTSITVL